MVSEAQQRAKRRWNDKSKDKNRIHRHRSYARKLVRDLVTDDDLKELGELIRKRLDGWDDSKWLLSFILL